MDRQIIVQGRHGLDDPFATLHFPSGILPKGKIKLTLLGLDYCTSRAHDHFKAKNKIPYPSIVEYSNVVRAPSTRMSTLAYNVRKSIMTLDLQSQPPPPLSAELYAPALDIPRPEREPEIVPMDVDQPENAFAPEEQERAFERGRLKRQAPPDDGGDNRKISVIGRFQTAFLRQTRYPNIVIEPTTTIGGYVLSLNTILAECYKQAGSLLSVEPQFIFEEPTAEELALIVRLGVLNPQNYKTLSVRLPFNGGVALPEGPPWTCLGFNKGFASITQDRTLKMIRNVYEAYPIARVRATYPVSSTETVHAALARIGKDLKIASLWIKASKEYQPFIGISHPLLAFGIDLVGFELKEEFQRDAEYTLLLVRFIADTVRECFQFNHHNYLQVIMADDGKMAFGAFPKLMENTRDLFTIKITFQDAEFAKQWGFSQRSLEYYAVVDTDIVLETNFRPDSTYMDLSEADKIVEKNRLYRALQNVYMVSNWGPTAETKMPSFLKMLLEERHRVLQGGADLPVYDPPLHQPPQEPAPPAPQPQEPAPQPQGPAPPGPQPQEPAPPGPQPQEPAPPGPQPQEPAPPGPQPQEPAPPGPQPQEPFFVPNPDPAPSNFFTPWSRPIVGACEPPRDFPDKYHILLHEGDKNDYIADLGPTCIWASKGFGTTRTLGSSGSGTIINNYEWDRTLHVQFLTSDLGLFKRAPGGDPQDPSVDAFLRATIMVKTLAPFT